MNSCNIHNQPFAENICLPNLQPK